MKKLVMLMLLLSPTLAFVGCGKKAGSITEGVEQSAVDKYMADQAKDQEAMNSSLSADGK